MMTRQAGLFADPDLSWRWKKVVGSKENTAEWKHALICEKHFDPATSFEFYQKGKNMGKRKLVKGITLIA